MCHCIHVAILSLIWVCLQDTEENQEDVSKSHGHCLSKSIYFLASFLLQNFKEYDINQASSCKSLEDQKSCPSLFLQFSLKKINFKASISYPILLKCNASTNASWRNEAEDSHVKNSNDRSQLKSDKNMKYCKLFSEKLTADLAQLRPTVPAMTHLWEANAASKKKHSVELWVTPRAIPSKKSWMLRANTIRNPLAVAWILSSMGTSTWSWLCPWPAYRWHQRWKNLDDINVVTYLNVASAHKDHMQELLHGVDEEETSQNKNFCHW